jgi:hypothetical protein
LQAANVKMAATIGHAVLDAVLMPAPPISQGIAGSNKLRGDRSRWESCKQNWLLRSMATRLVSLRSTLPVTATARVQGSAKGLRARGKGSHLPTEPPPRKAKHHLRNFFYESVADSRNCLRFFRFSAMVETEPLRDPSATRANRPAPPRRNRHRRRPANLSDHPRRRLCSPCSS